MTDEELIARLREWDGIPAIRSAADRIEALVKERDVAIKVARNEIGWRKRAEARVGRLEEALCNTLKAAESLYYGTAFEKEFRDEIATLKGADHE